MYDPNESIQQKQKNQRNKRTSRNKRISSNSRRNRGTEATGEEIDGEPAAPQKKKIFNSTDLRQARENLSTNDEPADDTKIQNKNKPEKDPEALKQRAKTLRHVDLEKLADEEQKKEKVIKI